MPSHDDSDEHVDNSHYDLYINCAQVEGSFKPICLLYRSLASSPCPPRPYIHGKGISRIFVFFVVIFDRVRAVKNLTTGITKNKKMSNNC